MQSIKIIADSNNPDDVIEQLLKAHNHSPEESCSFEDNAVIGLVNAFNAIYVDVMADVVTDVIQLIRKDASIR